MLLYGYESWVISKDMEKKINSFATSCYRIELGIKRMDKISNAEVYTRTNWKPLFNSVIHCQFAFLGHILRLPNKEPAKQYALYIPKHGKRRCGRQNTTYLRHVQQLLGDNEGLIKESQVTEFAQDRVEWRKLVVACSAAEQGMICQCSVFTTCFHWPEVPIKNWYCLFNNKSNLKTSKNFKIFLQTEFFFYPHVQKSLRIRILQLSVLTFFEGDNCFDLWLDIADYILLYLKRQKFRLIETYRWVKPGKMVASTEWSTRQQCWESWLLSLLLRT